jgi:hypothetical protein
MTSRERLLAAWNHEETDRVPIELQISAEARRFPEAERIIEFVDGEADNFLGAPAFDWGFCGLATESRIEPGREEPLYTWKHRSERTASGEFTAVTRHRVGELIAGDFHWERRFIHDLDDMRRLADATWVDQPVDTAAFRAADQRIGGRGVPLVGVLHPLGWLVRHANMSEVYQWFRSERELLHRFLEKANTHVTSQVRHAIAEGVGPFFTVTAHEMLIPPWVGRDIFDEFVVPYDSMVNRAIHEGGGKLRAHCHGFCYEYLDAMQRMGIDSIEPLEPPPFGDVDLAGAKRLVGDRMLLSGNVLSQYFPTMTAEEVGDAVAACIEAGKPGGGFSLRTTGGVAATNSVKTPEQMRAVLCAIEAYIDAGLRFGGY